MTTKLSNEQLIKSYRTILLSRLIDEKEMILLKQGKIYFHISGPGHEACQVAISLAMKPGYDWAYPYYRDLAFVLQYGLSIREVLEENMNRASGISSKGRQMPTNFGSKKHRIVSQSSPTGTQFLQAVGTAMGIKISKSDEIVYVSSGEGATSEGEFAEAVAWASRKKLPVIFMVQNNGYAISVPVSDQTPGSSITKLYSNYPNLKCIKYDGTDFQLSYDASVEAVEWARSGKGPAMLEADCVRLFPHSSSDDPKKYRPLEEINEDKKRDPILKLKEVLISNNILSVTDLEKIYNEIKLQVDKEAEVAESSPLPDPKTVTRNLYSPHIIVQKENFVEPSHSGKSIVMVDAINHALHEELKRNEKIIVYGEDIADGKGGVFTATKGLSTNFGSQRVFNSPIAEASIVGTAVGLAVRGYKPVVEIQFGDYIWPSFMQFKDEVVCMRYRSDGDYSCPMVVRVAVGGYIRGGLYHSQCIESIFAHLHGLWIAFPSNAADAKGLLKTAIREDNPVLFCEHKGLYRQQFAASPEPDENYCLPFGIAKIKKEGTDVTIVTYGFLVQRSLEAARKLEEQGVSCEVIDLRTIIPWDKETVINSVKKTGKVLIAHEDSRTAGFGAEIASTIAEECFQNLDAPVSRVGANDTPVPFAPILEDVTLPQERDITNAIQKLINY